MRRSASERVRDLKMRVAKLERQANPFGLIGEVIVAFDGPDFYDQKNFKMEMSVRRLCKYLERYNDEMERVLISGGANGQIVLTSRTGNDSSVEFILNAKFLVGLVGMKKAQDIIKVALTKNCSGVEFDTDL